MNLKELKEAIDQLVENAENSGIDLESCEVEVWAGSELCYTINEVGQFSVHPNVILDLDIENPKFDWRK